MTRLTVEELAEFTVFNAVAYDYHRKESQLRDAITPCWLVMSVEARQRCRDEVCTFLRLSHPDRFGDLSDETIKSRINDMQVTMIDVVNRWQAAELHFKQLREKGDPTAFFCEVI